MSISLEILKQVAGKVKGELNRDKEPVEEMKNALGILDSVRTGKAKLESEAATSCFYEDFLEGIAKLALKCSHFRNPEMIDCVRTLCLKLVRFFPEHIERNSVEFATIMRYVLDPEMAFYRECGNLQLSAFTKQVAPEEEPEWRRSLKKGDRIDVVKQEKEPMLICGWSTGTIQNMGEDRLIVSFDGETEKEDKAILLTSRDFTKYGVYTGGSEWRDAFKTGDVVDCMDKAGSWYQSTVLDVKTFLEGKSTRNVTKVFVGYRVFREDGVRKNSEGRVYTGWGSSQDEWITNYSLRIQRPGTVARLGVIKCKKSEDEDEKLMIQDYTDVLLNSMTSRHPFALLRADYSKNEYLVSSLNLFGKEGGFDLILSKIQDKTQVLGFELVYFYFDIIALTWKIMHKKFLQQYIPRLQQAVIEYFLSAPDVEVRKMQKARVDKTIKNLDYLLRRVYTVVDRYRIVEGFQLHLNTMLMKTKYLQRRIDGLKGVNELCKSSCKGTLRSISQTQLVDWILRHSLLDDIFGEQKHQQLVQRGAPILSMLYEQKQLTPKLLDFVWTSNKEDQHSPDIIKAIIEAGLPVQSAELEYVAKQVLAIPPAALCDEALDLLSLPSKQKEKSAETILKYSEYLLEIVMSKECPVQLGETALGKFCDMIYVLDYVPHKQGILKRIIEGNLRKGENTVVGIKMIQRIVNKFLIAAVPGIAETRESVMEFLVSECQLVQVIFENFERYYALSKEGTEVERRYGHEDQINERIEFLTYVMENAPRSYKLPIECIYKLWRMLYESTVASTDSRSLFRYLKQIACDRVAFLKNFEPVEAQRFFEEKMANIGNDYSGLTLEALRCIQQYFSLINQHQGLLAASYASPAKSKSYTSYSNVSGPSYDTYSFTKGEQEMAVEVKSKVNPNNLLGMEVFWKIVQEASDPNVVEHARDIINRLYTQLADESMAPEIRTSFIETYLDKLAAVINKADSRRSTMLGRMISLMLKMIDESERKGTGGLKSHSALLRGELISLTIHNKLLLDKNILKKMEVQTYSHTTIWDLKVEIGKYFGCCADCINLVLGTTEIKDNQHGMTIGEFVTERSSVLNAEKKRMEDVPKLPLLTPEGGIVEKFRAALTEIFLKFSKSGKMNAEQIARFIENTTNDAQVLAEDNRVRLMLNNYDFDKDGCIELEGFFTFYKDSLEDGKEYRVRDNLLAHGFRNDLKKINEVTAVPVDTTTLPRYILSSNPKAFDLLFRALEVGAPCNQQAWTLINRLATNESYYNQLLKLDKKSGDWGGVIDTRSTYLFLYCLQIIDSFIEEDENMRVSSADSAKREWRKQFLSLGGFEFLVSTLLSASGEAGGSLLRVVPTAEKHEKECLCLLLKIIHSLIKAAALTTNKGLHKEVMKFRVSTRTRQDTDSRKMESKPGEDAKTVDDKDAQEGKASEPEVDLHEVFKQKPSTVFVLKKQEGDDANGGEEMAEYTSDIGDGLAAAVKKCTEENKVWLVVIDTMSMIILQPTIDKLDSHIYEAAMKMYLSCALLDPAVFSATQTHKSRGLEFGGVIVKSLLCCYSREIRHDCAEKLFFLSSVLNGAEIEKRPLDQILVTLLGNIPLKEKEVASYCDEFFTLLGKLTSMHYLEKSRPKLFDARELVVSLVEGLKKHKTIESRKTDTKDHLLIGLINSITRILFHEEGLQEEIATKHGLLEEIFAHCLFPRVTLASESLPSLGQSESTESFVPDAQKCKGAESREAAYTLLRIICKGSGASLLYLLQECIDPLCRSIKRHEGWAYVPTAESRSKLGYAGIINPGCICYMNSMLQQFYMVPAMRYAILGVDDKKPPNRKKPEDVDDNVLHQLQKMFASMELTERIAYNSAEFCFAFKDQDGRPTNMAMQQDAQEFLNLMLDRLENSLKHTTEKFLLQSIFGGKTCSQLVCKGGCGNVRNNFEDFLNLSLGVKGNKTLYEALNKFIVADQVSDFYCEKCEKKVNVLKRTCLSELPNVLIIHLQRFCFNYDSLVNEKINSRLEFPQELDLGAYTVEGLERMEKTGKAMEGQECYKYRLVGVVVHFGTADVGHYISYIDTGSATEGGWLEFNDKNVRTFDPSKLEAECFGGSSETRSSLWILRSMDQKIKNAYMLVYEKIEKSPIKKVVPKEELGDTGSVLERDNSAASKPLLGQIYFDKSADEYYRFVDVLDYKRKVPRHLAQPILDDNSNFLFEQQIYSQDFFKFVRTMLNHSIAMLPSLAEPAKHTCEISITRIAQHIIFDVLSHAYHNLIIHHYVEDLVQLFATSEAATDELLSYLLRDNMNEAGTVLSKCTDIDARKAVARLVAEVALIQLPRDGMDYMVFTVEQFEKHQEYKYKTKLGQLLFLLNAGINQNLAANWLRFDQYFEVIYQVTTRGGDNMAVFMNDKRLIACLLDFYLGSDSPLYVKGEKRNPMGGTVGKPMFQNLINTVCYLACKTDLSFVQPRYKEIAKEFGLSAPMFPLDEDEKKCVGCKEFLRKTIVEGHATPEFAKLVAFVCYENEKLSKLVSKWILQGLNEGHDKVLLPYFTMLKLVMRLEDSLQRKRIEWLFGICTMERRFSQLAPTAQPHEQVKLGLQLINTIKDCVHDYPSVLNYKERRFSLLSLMWKNRKNLEISAIKCMLELMMGRPILLEYVTALPPPNYQYAKYTDWIKPLIAKYPSRMRMYSGYFSQYYSQTKDMDAYEECKKLLTAFEEKSAAHGGVEKPEDSTILTALPRPYLVGKPLEQRLLREEEKAGVKLSIFEIITEIFESLPTGKHNNGIPEGFFAKKQSERRGLFDTIPNIRNVITRQIVSQYLGFAFNELTRGQGGIGVRFEDQLGPREVEERAHARDLERKPEGKAQVARRDEEKKGEVQGKDEEKVEAPGKQEEKKGEPQGKDEEKKEDTAGKEEKSEAPDNEEKGEAPGKEEKSEAPCKEEEKGELKKEEKEEAPAKEEEKGEPRKEEKKAMAKKTVRGSKTEVQADDQPQPQKEEEVKPWKTGATVIKIEVYNTTKKAMKVRLDLKPKEGSKVNFYCPNSTLVGLVESERRCILHFLLRRELEEPWGEFETFWTTKQKSTQGLGRGSNPEAADAANFAFSDDGSMDDDEECPNCQHYNSATSEYCSHCHEPLYY